MGAGERRTLPSGTSMAVAVLDNGVVHQPIIADAVEDSVYCR